MALSALTRYYQYSQERFALTQFLPLSLLLASAASFGAQRYLYGGVKAMAPAGAAAVALFLFFLRLRLFDEFKDAGHDAIYYPSRPVPRGLVSLAELRRIIFILVFLELIISAAGGIYSLTLFLAALTYSLLMFKEFFLSSWLRRHFTLYILSHEILLIPLFFYLYALNGLNFNQIGQSHFWYLTILLACQLFLLEVTRKIRPQELEIPSRDTYTAQYGITGAMALAALLAVGAVTFAWLIAQRLVRGQGWLDYLPLLFLLGFLLIILTFIASPNKINARKVFAAAIALVFMSGLVFIAKMIF